ncbi:PDR/VanB family oxidoreductase [Pseudonocardia sp. NPDC049635]|uniref:PDR/VanB family oxidoreductase n=1 Tax=Pseudonocardia sp. NPDC049635 TaxID=3155506 RepID=UPI0033CA0D8A
MSSIDGSLELIMTDVHLEADGVISIAFADPAGRDLPQWQPGAHLELVLPSGLLRQYSLCGRPEDRKQYKVAVLHQPAGRGGSRELHETGLVGRRIRVNGPRNHFALKPSPRYVFIAGGIGVTPILSMARAVGDTAPWRLHYGGRSRASMAFVDELQGFGGDRVDISPQDVHGLLDIDGIVATADASTAIYCCGPAALLDAVQEARERLAPEAALYFERFAAAHPDSRLDAVPAGGERPFVVELRRSGRTVEIAPDRSALDVIREVVPGMPYSCTEGYCGSCEVAVLDGTPDHRDEILTPEERARGRTMFPCVSRALSERLVLDV